MLFHSWEGINPPGGWCRNLPAHNSLVIDNSKSRNVCRKPDKSELEETTSCCPYCSVILADTELVCSGCKNNIPFCIATVSTSYHTSLSILTILALTIGVAGRGTEGNSFVSPRLVEHQNPNRIEKRELSDICGH